MSSNVIAMACQPEPRLCLFRHKYTVEHAQPYNIKIHIILEPSYTMLHSISRL